MLNRKILGVTLAAILALSLGMVMAVPVLAADVNDGESIQAAIDAASPGDTITVAAGTYAGFTVPDTKSGLTILGAQADVDAGGSVDRGTAGDGDESVITGNVTIKADNVELNGFKMNAGIVAVGYDHAHNVKVSYNIFDNVTASWGAIHLHGFATGPSYHEADGGYVGYNTIVNPVGDGIWTVGNDNVTIEYNHIVGSSGAAIQALNHVGTGITIHSNTITNSGGKGINYWADDGSSITDNIITNSTYEAIFTDAQVGITGNQISNTGAYGILVYSGAAGTDVSGNQISGSTFEGIQSDVLVSISGNTITGGYNGIQLSNSAAGSTVSGNTISNPDWIGIKTWVVAQILNNSISGGWAGIELVGASGGTSVMGNSASGTTAESLRIWVQDAFVSNNDFSGGWSGVGIWADGAQLNGNRIHDNQYYGVCIYDAVNTATITGNQLSNNPYPGITIFGDGAGAGFQIHFNEITGNSIFGVESFRTDSPASGTYNWWGDVTGPFDNSNDDFLDQLNPGGLGDNISEYVLYDPWIGQGGMVTGGGWIDPPPGAYAADPLLAGKATFGFVLKYKKGANVPDGQTEFQFKAGALNFHSSSYDWLVVTGSDYARFKGTGTINGEGEYKFMIWAGDSDPDTFRIRIWYEEEGIEITVYDNGMDQAIGGGSIVIHTK